MAQSPTIDRLLSLVPDSPTSVLSNLRVHPELASKQDVHGYSLLHAATSYEHLDLLRALIRDYHVDLNIKDEDGETCLFNAESVDFARELVSLGVNIDIKNDEGQTAAEKLDEEDEQPLVAAYLREVAHQITGGTASAATSTTIDVSSLPNGEASTVYSPPPLPGGVQISIGAMPAGDVGGEPDPEFRRRIEELAARPRLPRRRRPARIEKPHYSGRVRHYRRWAGAGDTATP